MFFYNYMYIMGSFIFFNFIFYICFLENNFLSHFMALYILIILLFMMVFEKINVYFFTKKYKHLIKNRKKIKYFYFNLKILDYLFKTDYLLMLFVPVSSRRWYLAKKYRSKKETMKREITHARKHSDKLDTYKGFYIPKAKPKDNLAKFFFRKREESNRLSLRKQKSGWKQFFQTKNFQSRNFFKKKFLDWKFEFKIKPIKSLTKKVVLNIVSKWLKKLLRMSFVYFKRRLWKQKFNFKGLVNYPISAYKLAYFSNWLRIRKWKFWRRKRKTIRYKAKSFKVFWLKPSYTPLNLQWFIQSKGISSKAFLNYFLLSRRPVYLSALNFVKMKLIFFWYLKRYLYNRLKLNKWYSFFKKWKANSLLRGKKFLGSMSYFVTENILSNSFVFFTQYLNWLKNYLPYLYVRNYLFHYLLFNDKLFFKRFFVVFLHYIFSRLRLFSKLKWKRNRIALRLFFSRLVGSSFSFFWKKKKRWKLNHFFKLKYSLTINYLQKSLNENLLIEYLFCWKNFFFQKKKKYFKIKKLFFFDFVTFFSKIYKELNTLLLTKNVFLLNPFQVFFFDFSTSIKKKSFFKPVKRSVSYFYYLYNFSMLRYKDLLSLFEGSFSQQLDLNVSLNLIHMFFWALIRRGKKLTARRVLKNFLIWFRLRYWIPGLVFLTHTILKIEPWIWLKKKWLAGWIYEIPLFISPRRSKGIAIRWLIKSAKKWKKYDFAEGLSGELWECSFNQGPTIKTWKMIHSIARRNRSYAWWL